MRTRRLVVSFAALACVAACDFSAGAVVCAGDENCPDDLVCRADADGVGRCVVDDGDDEDGEGEGEGEDGDGSCAAPFVRTLPFTFEGSSASGDDARESGCAPTPDLAEVAFVFTLDAEREVHIQANDSSGQGIAVETLRGTSCGGDSVDCQQAATGIVDKLQLLSAGTHTLVVERAPDGPFTLSVD